MEPSIVRRTASLVGAFLTGFLTLHGGFSLFRPTPARETLVVWIVIVALILAMLGFVSLRRKRGARLH